MNIRKYAIKRAQIVIKFIHLQLFITLISIPILLCWGMPISLLTFAGNLFFGPLLTAFLLFSSLAFFCQMLAIPNGVFIYCLEQVTHWWLWIMQWGSKEFLVALPLPSVVIIILIPIITLAILHCKKITHAYGAIATYALLLLFICGYLKWCGRPTMQREALACNKGAICIITDTHQLAVIDPGYIGQRLSAASWCEYTLMPHLVKKYGTATIDHMVILQPNKIIFDALLALIEKITIKNLYLPFWEGKIPFHWWRSYAQLRASCKEKQCKLFYVGKKDITVPLPQSPLIVHTLEERVQKEEFSYPCLQVRGTIDNQPLELYSAQYKKKALIKKENDGTPKNTHNSSI